MRDLGNMFVTTAKVTSLIERLKFVMCGINYYNKDILLLSTLQGYATAFNTLFQLRGFKQPTDLSNPSNMAGIIINNLIKEETVASQCSPLRQHHLCRAPTSCIIISHMRF